MLTKQKLQTSENWLLANARPLEVAKWNLIWGKGSKEELVNEMLKYQNADGGFGSGFEADILTPESAAIQGEEAIFMAHDYDLDLTADWAMSLLNWFENTVSDTPNFWVQVPKSVNDYPHAPWWNYQESDEFNPNPSALVASAMLIYGTKSQKILAEKIANKSIDYILNSENCWSDIIYCLQPLIIALQKINSPLINDKLLAKFNDRILAVVCLDISKYATEYVPQPLNFVSSPNSQWYGILKEAIVNNFKFLLDSQTNDGYWNPSFSWGDDSEASRQATQNWQGYGTVKNIKLFKDFDLIAK